MAKEKPKIDSYGAFQLAVDLEFMLNGVFKNEIIDSDPLYEDKLKKLKELTRWKKYLRLFFSESSSTATKPRSIHLEIGDLKELKTSLVKRSKFDIENLHKYFSILEL